MEAKVVRWREVESGARYTATTAVVRYPQLTQDSCKDLRFQIARKPGSAGQAARDVKTYAAAAVDALAAARLAAPEPADPRWLDVESGARYTAMTAMARYPQLNHSRFFARLPSEIAWKPGSAGQAARDVKTFAAADVDALAARFAEPVPVDPRWREVESGARYTATTAMARYPQLNIHSFDDLPFELARKPTSGNHHTCNVKTYSASDVKALVAARAKKPEIAAKPSQKRAAAAQPKKKRAAAAPPKQKRPAAPPPKKRARAKQPEPPQEPKEDDECAICFADASRTHLCFPCGHKCVCASCASTHLSASGSRCPICRAEITATVQVFG